MRGVSVKSRRVIIEKREVSMDDEYEEIMKFFTMKPEDKASNLEDIFEHSIEFFNKFQHVLENGSDEEKTEILDKVHEASREAPR